MATKRNIILTLVAVLATIISAQGQQVDVEQSKITVLEGEQVAVLCRWGQPLQYCRIQIPGVPNALNLSPKYNRTPGFTYYGSGLENGQCGVTIDQVRGEYNGNIECFLGAEGTEFAGTVELTVARVPLTPEIAIVDNQGNAINTPGPFQVGQRIRATCISRDGRPASTITWYLDGHQLTDGLGQLETIESQHHSGQTLITTSQAIDLEIRADYDGRLLICSTENLATRGKTQDIKVPITVIYPPQPLPKQEIFGLVLGQSNLINITFRSNPPPRVAWIIDGQTIEEGRRYERYEVYQSIPYGQGYVNATLGIADLNIEDTSKTYTLRASNEFGSQEYTVRLSSAERAPDTGLGMGSIIGIVLGVAVILIIIAVVVIARITGKWCFSDNAGKTTTETSDTESVDFNSEKSKGGKFRFLGWLKRKSGDSDDANDLNENDANRNDDENRAPSDTTVVIEDDPPKQGDKQLVYAELMLKNPSDGGNPKATNNSTEYAEILYVSPNAEK